ncbi:MAG: porin [Gemmatimonadetes bacterium]|nr:porin [Gemmatimonadota bacterium]
MKALLTEAIGAFFLVLAIGLSVNVGAPLAALAIGLTLMVMVYAGGRISGAHYNPAVSIGLVVRGALPAGKLAGYLGAQFAGAIAAGLLVWKFTGQPMHVAPAEMTTALKAIAGEAVWTFALAYVVMHVATSKATEGNSYFGLAIGMTVAAGAIAMGPITGGAFNPAVGVGAAIVEMVLGREPAPLWWVYAVAPVLGAATAGVVFKFQES